MDRDKKTTSVLEIDEDFQLLKQAITKKERKKIKQSILTTGCIYPILVWKGKIVDGTKRYEICCENNIHYRIKHVPFETKEETIAFICKQQLKRTDLSYEMKRYLIGRLYRAEVASKTNGSKDSNEIRREYRLGKTCRKQDISKELAEYLGVCIGTIRQYTKTSESLDKIRKKDPLIADKILNGRLMVSHKNMLELEKLSSSDLTMIRKWIAHSDCDHIMYSDICHMVSAKKASVASTKQRKSKGKNNSEILIKQLPQYDPDSELSNLIYTIPTWISSINRSKNNADFSKITNNAKKQTLAKLIHLKIAIGEMEVALKEEF